MLTVAALRRLCLAFPFLGISICRSWRVVGSSPSRQLAGPSIFPSLVVGPSLVASRLHFASPATCLSLSFAFSLAAFAHSHSRFAFHASLFARTSRFDAASHRYVARRLASSLRVTPRGVFRYFSLTLALRSRVRRRASRQHCASAACAYAAPAICRPRAFIFRSFLRLSLFAHRPLSGASALAEAGRCGLHPLEQRCR